MPFWKKDEHKKELFTNVTDGLRLIYKNKLQPLEEAYRFHEFHSPSLEDSDFSSKPMVLLVGQYSVGKTSFIRYLLNVTIIRSATFIDNHMVSFFFLSGRFSWHPHRSR
jgi:polynucleotide 5'-kinase involved in rRNA processing